MFQKGNSVSSFPFEIERQARIERSLARGACVRGVMHAFAHGLRVLRLRGIPLVRDLATKWVLRRAMRELHRLDDRILADIGLTRGEIEFGGAPRAAHPETTGAQLGQPLAAAADRLVRRVRGFRSRSAQENRP